MKEKIAQLENLLREITKLIEQRIKIEQIDLEEYDDLYKNDPEPFDGREKHIFAFRTTIVSYKNDRSFYENDIPKLKSLLKETLSQLPESRFKGKRMKPDSDFIKLLEQGLLTTESPIFGNFDGKEYSGHLTKDGYFELNIDGKPIPFPSLRFAAILVGKRDIPNQWRVWYAIDKTGVKQTLEHFKEKLTGQK